MVEVGNGEGQIGAGGYYPSYEQYIMALDKGWHVAPTNNQDNHKGKLGQRQRRPRRHPDRRLLRARHLCRRIRAMPHVRH